MVIMLRVPVARLFFEYQAPTAEKTTTAKQVQSVDLLDSAPDANFTAPTANRKPAAPRER